MRPTAIICGCWPAFSSTRGCAASSIRPTWCRKPWPAAYLEEYARDPDQPDDQGRTALIRAIGGTIGDGFKIRVQIGIAKMNPLCARAPLNPFASAPVPDGGRGILCDIRDIAGFLGVSIGTARRFVKGRDFPKALFVSNRMVRCHCRKVIRWARGGRAIPGYQVILMNWVFFSPEYWSPLAWFLPLSHVLLWVGAGLLLFRFWFGAALVGTAALVLGPRVLFPGLVSGGS